MSNAVPIILFLGGFVLFVLGITIGRQFGPKRRKALSLTEASEILPNVLTLFHRLVDDDVDGALQVATDLARAQDLPAKLYLIIGDLCRQRGEFHKAIRIHQSLSIRTDLTNAERDEVQYHLGLDYYKGGFMNRAIALLTPLTRSRQYREASLKLVEEISFLTQDYEEALRWSKEKGASKDGLKIRQALYMAFEAGRLLETGDYEASVVRSRSALKTNPDNLVAYLFWGDALYRQGKEDLALEVWQKGIERRCDLLPLVMDRFERAFQDVKNPDGLPEMLERISSREECPRQVRLFIAEFLLARGGYPQAARILETYLASNPESLEGWANLTAIHLHLEKKDIALEDVSRIITLIGTSTPLYVCSSCGFSTGQHRWRCPQCRSWETFRLEGS